MTIVRRLRPTALRGLFGPRPLAALLVLVLTTTGLVALDPVAGQPAAAAQSSQGAPTGASSNSGAFTSQVPIEVPAFHGIEPNLGLVYDSSGGNGLVGVGWGLTVESYIERASKGRGAPTYGPSDIFLLDGEEVVPSTALGGEYVTKRQSFLRIVHDEANNRVIVTQKNGVKTIYAARHTVSAGTFRFMRSQVVDPYGNTVNYGYSCDPGHYCYVNKITYGSTTITLHKETRPDPVRFAAGGSPATINYRIKTIDVVTGGGRARAYKLTYATSASTSRSLLTRVQMFGKNATLDASGTVTGGSALPAVTLGYQGDANPQSFNVAKVGRSTGGGATQNWTGWCAHELPMISMGVADFNADGRDDLWCHNQWVGKTQLALSDGVGVSTLTELDWCRIHVAESQYFPLMVYSPQNGLADFNGDGYSDLWCHDPLDEKIALSDGKGGLTVYPLKSGWCTNPTWKVGIGDFNGDGKDDLWCHNQVNGGTSLALSNGTSFTTLPEVTGWCTGANSDFDVADVNGDGRMDAWCHNRSNGDTFVAQSNGDGTFTTYPKSMTWCIAGPPYGFGVTDHNGDGKSDFFCHGMGDGNNWVATSNGNGKFTAYPVSKPGWCYGSDTLSVGLDGDFNGDGRDDAWCHNSANGDTWVMFAEGMSGFKYFPKTFSACSHGPSMFGTGDFNGDGKADFYCHDSKSGDTWIATSGSVVGPTDLLTSQTTGMGGRQTISYRPSSVYSNTWLPDWLPTTVASVSVDDGRGTVITTNYNYSGARYDPVERRFLGFRVVSAKDSSGAGSWTTFRQGAGYPIGRAVQVDRKNSGGTLLERSAYSYSESAGGGVYTSLLTSYTHSMCSGATCQSSKTEYGYDGYGNINIAKLYGDTAVGGDERTEGTTYTYNTAKYIVDTPLQVNAYAGIGTTGTVGKQVRYTYNGAGDQISMKEWVNPGNTWVTSKATYDAYGNLTSTSDPIDAAAGKKTVTYTYDPTHHLFPVKACDLLSHCTTQAWDAVLQASTSVTDMNGKVTSWTYDTLGRMTKESRPDGSSTTHGWANLGNAGGQYQQDTVSDGTSNGLWSRTYFDGLGRTWQQLSEPNIVRQTRYNAQGQVSHVSLPFRSGGAVKWTSYAYDGLGRLVTATNPDGSKRQTSYSIGYNVNDPDFAKPKYRITDCDELGRCNSTTFNGFGQPQMTSDITPGWGSEYRSRSTYDVWGRLKTVTDNIGAKTTFSYDSLDRRTSVNDPDMGVWSYGYDGNSRLAWQKDARGQRINFAYDAVGRLAQEKTAGGVVLATYIYDKAGHGAGVGRMTSMSDLSGATSWSYDSMGRVSSLVRTSTIAGTSYAVSQTFDLAGRRKSLTYPGGEVVNHTYDSEGCLKQVGPYVTAATCTADGQLATRTFGNGITQSFSYNANRLWLAGDVTKNSGGATLLSHGYGYNTAGQITSRTSSDAVDKWTYGYDGLGRLKSATNTANSALNITANYDAAGRITSKTGSGGGYVYPAVNTAAPDHAPSKVGSRAYTYDPNGNRRSDGVTTYVYDPQNRLASTTKGGVVTNYAYDAFGERVKAGDTVTISIGDQQIMRVKGATKVKYYYYNGERVASQENSGVFRYYANDRLGSAHLILNNNGTVAKRTVYSPFGTVAQQAGSYTDPFGLAGGEADPSGLTRMGARYYDPVIGQFTSPDPSGALNVVQPQSLNRFAYVENDPVNFTDPSGFAKKKAGRKGGKKPGTRGKKGRGGGNKGAGKSAVEKAREDLGTLFGVRQVINPEEHSHGFEIDMKYRGIAFELNAFGDLDAEDPNSITIRLINGSRWIPTFKFGMRFNRDYIGYAYGFTSGKTTRGGLASASVGGGVSVDFYFNSRIVMKVSSIGQLGLPGSRSPANAERVQQNGPSHVVYDGTLADRANSVMNVVHNAIGYIGSSIGVVAPPPSNPITSIGNARPADTWKVDYGDGAGFQEVRVTYDKDGTVQLPTMIIR